ncbi:MAG: nitrate reductase molybdenum cofactor assembly chaperone [Rhodospirillales bacterium]
MRASLKALAALLSYPEAELAAAMPEIIDALNAEPDLAPAIRARLSALGAMLDNGDLIGAQERYVALFDRTRSLSLHLFEHVHGDSRERGPAMVDLLGIYQKHGLKIANNELPDYLPLYLEYASLLDAAAGAAAIRDVAHILAAVRDRLTRRHSSYAAVFDAVLALSGAAIAPEAEPVKDEDADDPAAMDRAWEDAAVVFGPDSDPAKARGCDRAATMLRRMGA